MSGVPPNKPTKYLGANVYLISTVTVNRRPTGADVNQPATGNLYPICTVWQVGKEPTTGLQGEIWILTAIIANVAYWKKIANGVVFMAGFNVDASTAPGSDPVEPDIDGNITVTGGQVAAGMIANVLRSNSLAASTFTYQIQQAGAVAAKDITMNGVAHFNTGQFSVDEGFVSLIPTEDTFPWTDQSTSASAVANHGYFATAALTLTLPASPSQGDLIRVVADTASAVVVDAPAGQFIRIGNVVSASGGTATSSTLGNSLTLFYRASSLTWVSTAVQGTWAVV